MNNGDAEFRRLGDGRILLRFAAYLHFALVFLIYSADYFHQRGFSRSVFAEQCMHLARPKLEIDFVECDDSGKELRYSLHLHKIFFHFSSSRADLKSANKVKSVFIVACASAIIKAGAKFSE